VRADPLPCRSDASSNERTQSAEDLVLREGLRSCAACRSGALGIWGGDDEDVQLIGGLGAFLERRPSGCLQDAQHFDRTVPGLGLGSRRPRLYGTGGCLGINHVGLSPAAPILALWAHHFHDVEPATGNSAPRDLRFLQLQLPQKV
jgi:hypothetical protein